MPKTPDEVRQLAKETGIKIVDLKFVDLPGGMAAFLDTGGRPQR